MRNLFSTRVKVILVLAALLTVGLSVLSSVTNITVADLAVQGLLAPFRAAATSFTRTAEKYYGYMFRYEALAAEKVQKEGLVDTTNTEIAELLVRWQYQEIVIPSITEPEKEFDPMDESQVDLSGIVNAKPQEEEAVG